MKRILLFSLAGWLMASGAFAQQSSLSTTLPAQTADDKDDFKRKYEGSMSISLTGRHFDDEVINSRFSRAAISADFDARFLEWLDGRLSVAQIFTSGASSNLYAVTEGGTGLNALLLDEASLTLKPFKGFKASGGILAIDQNPIASIIGPNSWTAATVAGSTDVGAVTLTASALQGIPTSRGTSNQVLDEDTLPLYTNGTLMAALKTDSGFGLSVAGTHFVFTDLSSTAAGDSEQLGATVIGTGKNALFAYDYRGMEYAAAISQKFLNGDVISLRASSLRNELAPSGQNSAGQVKIEYKKALDRWNIAGNITPFRIESDAFPSTYASPSGGFTNRQGTMTNLKIENKKHKITALAGYTKADVLDTEAQAARYQSDREIYTLGVEVKHDLF
ncbi:MAG: hypothetical protein KF802_15190 [Bdellovibrionaceae bacterium]|nr:hypothetical protein [Pseudobdellovibrionaceae bacterium]